MKKLSQLILVFAVVSFAGAPSMAALPPMSPVAHAAHLQPASAKRFKRGVRRTYKKVRHFVRRAAGKH